MGRTESRGAGSQVAEEGVTAPDWRTGEGFEWTLECGLTALAWEFLRFNPDYREYVRNGVRFGDEPPDVSRWGLRFRRRPKT
ncbi:transcriptional regulator domain-containing protein [Sandaracinobacteroides saxicola]|uniref:transcriptional regulator domain-containing protein n=1 Tax=Sandaracinobacteroides saxicola TaxID=2759707 RepID=UPI0037D99402